MIMETKVGDPPKEYTSVQGRKASIGYVSSEHSRFMRKLAEVPGVAREYSVLMHTSKAPFRLENT